MRIITIDFEGSLKNGIREIGAVISKNENIIKFEDHRPTKYLDCLQTLKKVFHPNPQLIVSHNVQIEKNLLKKYMPYRNDLDKERNLEWGPWLDTKKLYQKLYPNIKSYDLSTLTDIFIKRSINKITLGKIEEKKIAHHNALYDSLCAFFLFKRIFKKIDINQFVQ